MKKKLLIAVVIAVSGSLCLAGCAAGNGSVSGQPSETVQIPETTLPQETTPPASTEPQKEAPCPIGVEDTYWVATAWHSEDTGDGGVFAQQEWAMDLTVYVDGTACFRDVREGINLTEDSYRSMFWERSESGEYLFYSKLSPEPILRGTWHDGSFALDYFGLTLAVEPREMPRTAGERCSPAELAGTWLMVTQEENGCTAEAMPWDYSSLVLEVAYAEEGMMLTADMEQRNYDGQLLFHSYDREVTVENQPMFDGCENEAWCVSLGTVYPLDEQDNPQEFEVSATLLDYNTMLVQRRSLTEDGAVTRQTYWRFPELTSWISPQDMELEYSNWECIGYTTFAGENMAPPEEMENLAIVLCPDGTCSVSFDEDTWYAGSWELGRGGLILIRDEEDAFRFGGAVSGYYVQNGFEAASCYQMALYYNGGILQFNMGGYG